MYVCIESTLPGKVNRATIVLRNMFSYLLSTRHFNCPVGNATAAEFEYFDLGSEMSSHLRRNIIL
jgi:hypothetical protein